MGRKPRAPRRTGRKRKAAGWVLLIAGVLVAGVWAASLRWWFGRAGTRVSFSFRGGAATILYDPEGDDASIGVGRGWGVQRRPEEDGTAIFWHTRSADAPASPDRLNLWMVSRRNFYGLQIYIFAFWPVPLLLWTPAVLLLRSGTVARRRALKNVCIKCGYSLAGLAKNASCPECGNPHVMS